MIASPVANLTIKGFPDDVYDDLKAAAAASRRSIAAEATVLLERALGRRPEHEAELRARARHLRERTPVRLDADALRTAIEEGRA